MSLSLQNRSGEEAKSDFEYNEHYTSIYEIETEANVHMYALPGRTVSEDQVSRYIKSKKRLEAHVARERAFALLDGNYKLDESLIKEELNSDKKEERALALRAVEDMEDAEEREGLLLWALDSQYEDVQVATLERMARYLQDKEKTAPIIRRKFKSESEKVVLGAFRAAQYILDKEELLTLSLELAEASSAEVEIAALILIRDYVDKDKAREIFEEKAQRSNDSKVLAWLIGSGILSDESKWKLIRKGLESGDKDLMLAAVHGLDDEWSLNKMFRLNVVRDYLESGDSPTKELTLTILKEQCKEKYLKDRLNWGKLMKKLRSSDREVMLAGLNELHSWAISSDKYDPQIIRSIAESEDGDLMLVALKKMHNLGRWPIKAILRNIKKGNPSFNYNLSGYLKILPEKILLPVIFALLETKNAATEDSLWHCLYNAGFDEEVKLSILSALISRGDDKMRIGALAHIDLAPQSKWPEIILDAIKNSQSQEVQSAAIAIITHIPNPKRNQILLEIRSGCPQGTFARELGETWSQEPEIRIKAMLGNIGQWNKGILLKTVELEIKSIPEEEQKRAIQDYCQAAHEHNRVLYRNHDIGTDLRQDFKKDGSELTTLGKEFANKVIIRHISTSAFSYWQRAYENWKTWKSLEFDYVPIEPIVSFNVNRGDKSKINVVAGTLGMTLDEYIRICPNSHKEKLLETRDRIVEGLNQLEINHNHAHRSNFCIYFEEDESGQVNLEKVPRLYLIDFDMAEKGKTIAIDEMLAI